MDKEVDDLNIRRHGLEELRKFYKVAALPVKWYSVIWKRNLTSYKWVMQMQIKGIPLQLFKIKKYNEYAKRKKKMEYTHCCINIQKAEKGEDRKEAKYKCSE